MPRWEYRQVVLEWSHEEDEWISEQTSSQPKLSGEAVLAHYGDDGWELVGVVISDYVFSDATTRSAGSIHGPAGGGALSTTFVTGWCASQYIHYFKRPKEH